MNYKKINVATLQQDDILESLDLADTDYVFNLVEDLSEALAILGEIKDVSPGIITAVAVAQRLLIDVCRIDLDEK